MNIRRVCLWYLYFCFTGVVASAAQPLVQTDAYPEHEVLSVMRNVCDWQIANNYDADFTWIHGALLPGITGTAEVTKDDTYMDAATAWAEKYNWLLRTRSGNLYHADDHCCGQTYLDLYLLDDPQPSRYADTQSRMDYIIANPQPFSCTTRTAKVYDWCDSLFMAPPVWSRLSHITGTDIYRNELFSLWMDSQNCLFNDDNDHDDETPDFLWWRDKNYIDDRYNGKKVFWGRGNGWVAGGLVRVLQFTPSTDPSRANYITVLQQMANALKDAQQPDGCWRANILSPEQYPNPEISGTGFFTYMIAYGINEGLLDPAVYGTVVENAWDGMNALAVHPDGKVGYVQPVGAGPAAATYDNTQYYGVGAFLMAGSEMFKYYQSQNADIIDNFESYSSYNPLKTVLSDSWNDQDDNGTTAVVSLEGIADQKLKLVYNNSQSPYIAETYREFSTPENLLNDNQVLSFYIKGHSSNTADQLYCKLIDTDNQVAIQRISDTSIVKASDWVQINFDLNEFSTIDLTCIKQLAVGIGQDNPTGPAGNGTVWIDEISLSEGKCIGPVQAADFDNNCQVDLTDFSEIASMWMAQYEAIQYPVEPDPVNLMAHWTFDETSGVTAYDSTSNGRNCTLVGATWTTAGKIGGAVSINGESNNANCVEMSASAISLSQGTCSMWLNLNADQSTQKVRYIWGHTTLPTWGNRIQLYMDGYDTKLDCGLGGQHALDTSIQTLDTQTWYHIALTWDSGSNTFQVYVDGFLKASGTYSNLDQLQSIAHIGNNGNTSSSTVADQAFFGCIDEVRIYNTVLTQPEILYLADVDVQSEVENPLPIDLKPDGIIDMKDLLLFLSDWASERRYP